MLVGDVFSSLEEWRAARQDIFDNVSRISDENTERWRRLSEAEHRLMAIANVSARPVGFPPGFDDILDDETKVRLKAIRERK